MQGPKENPKGSLLRPVVLVLSALVSAAMLAAVGFGIGWFLSGRQLADAGGGDGSPPPTTVPRREATLPTSDAAGEDLPGLPRYPGSVRVGYERNVLEGGSVLTEANYLASGKVGEVKDYYRGVFRSGEWTIADLDFSAGTWSFVVVEDRRQAYLEIAPQTQGMVEVGIRMSERHEAQGARKEDADGPKRADAGPGSRKTAAPSPPALVGEPGDDYEEDFDDDYGEDRGED